MSAISTTKLNIFLQICFFLNNVWNVQHGAQNSRLLFLSLLLTSSTGYRTDTDCWLQDGHRVLATGWTQSTFGRWTQSTDYRMDTEYVYRMDTEYVYKMDTKYVYRMDTDY